MPAQGCPTFAENYDTMKRRAFLLLIALATFVGANAMDSKKGNKTAGTAATSTVSGIVIDKSSSEKLAGVMIQLADTDQKIYSNAKGEFIMEGIEPGTYKVKINCISYKDKEVTITVAKSKTEKLKVLLSPIEP